MTRGGPGPHLGAMRQMILSTALAVSLAAPVAAQEGDISEGLGLLSEGMGLLLEGLMDEIGPALEEAQPLFRQEILPFIERMGRLMDDITAYDLPERLPNGDIIIRRLPDAPPLPEPLPDAVTPGDDGVIEL